MEVILLFLALGVGLWWLREKKAGRPWVSPDGKTADQHLLEIAAQLREQREYEKARLSGEAPEGVEEWRKQREAEHRQTVLRMLLMAKPDLRQLDPSIKSPKLTRDEIAAFGTGYGTCVGKDGKLGILPEEADLYHRAKALNAEIGIHSSILYLKDIHKRDSEQLERDKMALKKLDRDWSALRATVEHEYFAAARQEFDKKHPGSPYTAEFVSTRDDQHYPWLSGHWYVVSKEWARPIDWHDKEGRPIDARSPSLNGAVVFLFREIEKARAENRIRRQN